MDDKNTNLDLFVKKLLHLQAEKDQEDSLSDDDLKYIAEGMGIEVADLEQARKDYTSRASGHLKYHNWQDAVKEYQELIILAPQSAEAYYGLALAHTGLWRDKNDTEAKNKAIQCLERTLSIDSDHQQAFRLLSQLRKEKKKTNTHINNWSQARTKKKANFYTIPLPLIVGLAVVLFISFMIGIFKTSRTSSSEGSYNPSNRRSYNMSNSRNIYHSIAGIDAKGAVYWSIEYEQYSTKEGLVRSFFARIVNPKSGKELKKVYFAKEESITNYKWRKAKLVEGKLYNFDEDKKTFEARDIRTGEVVENPKILSKKYPQLSEGVGEIKEDDIWYKITLRNGDVFWYTPHLNLFQTEEAHKAWTNNYKNPPTFTSYEWNFEQKGAKKRYYLFEKEKKLQSFRTYKHRPMEFKTNNNVLNNRNDRYMQARYGTMASKQPSEWFLQSEVLYGDKDLCLILHKEEVVENSPNILTAIDRKGNKLWEKKGLKSVFLKNIDASRTILIKEAKFGNTLVLSVDYLKIDNKSYRFAMGIHLASGKILWEYSPNYQAD